MSNGLWCKTGNGRWYETQDFYSADMPKWQLVTDEDLIKELENAPVIDLQYLAAMTED